MILFKITLFLCIFFLVFHLTTKKYLNPYKLTMVFGKKGAGKTTFLTKLCIKAYRDGYKIYSTTPIPGAELFNPSEIGFRRFEPESIILIDEVSLIWDNRNWKNMKPEVVEFFRYQRHFRLKVYMFSQSFDVDKKLRDLCDQLFLLKNFMRIWSIARRINKRVTVSSPSEDEDGNQKQGCLVEDYSFAPVIFPGNMIWTYIPRWSVFFDSYEGKVMPDVNSKLVLFNGQQYAALSKKGYAIYWIQTPIRWIKQKRADFLRKRSR